MRVWIVTIGEPLPLPGNEDRLHRSGMIAEYLTSKGHEVTWFTSTFDHFRKKHLFENDTEVELNSSYRLILLNGGGYAKNISFARIRDHKKIAVKFRDKIHNMARPDIIVSSFPAIEMSLEAVRFSKGNGIPIFVDVRDLWPDIFVDAVPKFAHWLGKFVLQPMFRQTRNIFRDASGIIGISRGYLDFGLRYAGRAQCEADSLFPLGYKGSSFGSSEKMGTGLIELSKLGIDPNKTTLWFLGTFGATYDLVPVIETARKLEQKGIKNIQFVLSGSGERDAEYRALAQNVSNIVFTGWVNALQIKSLMAIADVGLAAYAVGAPQGLPNKFFEYLSAGIPILSSLQGEASDVLKSHQCGLTYVEGSSLDLTMKIESLLSDPTLIENMGRNGKSLFDREYSADIIYPKLVRFLENNIAKQTDSPQLVRIESQEREIASIKALGRPTS